MSKKSTEHEKFSNFNVVVFGGDGDLAFRKIYPALFHRMLDGQIDEHFNVIAITRKAPDEKAFQEKNWLNTTSITWIIWAVLFLEFLQPQFV